MIHALKRTVKGAFRSVGLEVTRAGPPITDYQAQLARQGITMNVIDFDKEFFPIAEEVRQYTMTSIERMYGLYKAVEYIVKAQVPGDIVECGVWRGGSMMLVAKTLLAFNDTSRILKLFDTFEGHPKPDPDNDVDLYGNRAVEEWEQYRKTDESSSWAYAAEEDVQRNMASIGYPNDKIVLVKGMVENTAAANAPSTLSLVRLDTDWYASAKVELETFWPRLSRRGIMIVDDYGHYPSQRRAVEEYFASAPVMLHRVDYSCRCIVKTD